MKIAKKLVKKDANFFMLNIHYYTFHGMTTIVIVDEWQSVQMSKAQCNTNCAFIENSSSQCSFNLL